MTMMVPGTTARSAADEVISAVSPRSDAQDYNACATLFDGEGGRTGLKPNDCADGYQVQAYPEALLGVHCPTKEPNTNDKARAVRGVQTDTRYPSMSVVFIDFTFVGPVGQVRAALKTLYTLAAFNATRFVGVVAGTTDVVTAPAGGFPTSVGVRLEWGVGLTSYAPFAMTITTAGFLTLFGAGVLDRTMTLRVRDVNGGELFIPWAHRPTGMSMAQNMPGNAPIASTITISGLPATIAAAFSLVAQFLAPFSPITAQWIQGIGALDCSGGCR
jgi:hypothetical protein